MSNDKRNQNAGTTGKPKADGPKPQEPTHTSPGDRGTAGSYDKATEDRSGNRKGL